MNIETYSFQKEVVQIMRTVPFPFTANVEMGSQIRFEAESLILKLTKYCLAKEDHSQEEYGEIKYPADWWQHFKERFFPSYLLARFPVEYKTVRVLTKRLIRMCPHSDTVFSKGPKVHFNFLEAKP